jgi:hypothetical protein
MEAEYDEEKRNERTLEVSRVKVTLISVSTASKAQNSQTQYLFMGQLEELKVLATSGGTAEQSKQLKQLVTSGAVKASPSSRHCATPSIQEVQEPRVWST